MDEIRSTFDRDLANIQKDLLLMGHLVTEALLNAIRAFDTKDEELAAKVIFGDAAIDELQISIEDRTVELIALQQPIAKDLRILSTALKMTTDLERIGDHAKKIAKIVHRIGQDPLLTPLAEIPKIAGLTVKMIQNVLKAYVNLDVQLAMEVIATDDQVDDICDACKHDILCYMVKDTNNIPQGTALNKIVQRLERVGDHGYYYTYGSALFIVINANNYNAVDHKNLIEKAIKAHPKTKWRIVVMHQDIYGSGLDHSDSDGIILRTQLTPIYDANKIDVVLQGHDAFINDSSFF